MRGRIRPALLAAAAIGAAAIGIHPSSMLVRLTNGGADYSNAQTPVPSDSFPGRVGQVTGGNPKTTGIYYDAEYSHALLPP